MTPRLFALILIAVSIAGPAEARHRKPEPPTLADAIAGAAQRLAHSVADSFHASGAALAEAAQRAPEGLGAAFYGDGEVVAHPTGCPPRLFCGCGASVRLYGHPVPELYAAASWRRYPRAECGRNRVAVFAGHVAVILACHADGTALAYDANSGGGLTRIHTISLPSLIVEPPASL